MLWHTKMMYRPDDHLVLLDSNILIYAEQAEDPHHGAAKSLRDRALAGEIRACISPQVLSEFFAIVTNPRRVSTPLTAEKALENIRNYNRSQKLLKIFPGHHIINRMIALLETHPISGQNIHDLYLVATMLENDVSFIYTYNVADFARISEIQVLNPEKVDVPEPEETEETEKPPSQTQE